MTAPRDQADLLHARPYDGIRPANGFGARVEGWSAAEWTLSRRTAPGEIAPLPGMFTAPLLERGQAAAPQFPDGSLVPATRFTAWQSDSSDDPEADQAALGQICPLPLRQSEREGPAQVAERPTDSAARRLGRQRSGKPQVEAKPAHPHRSPPRNSLDALAQERRRR